MKQSIQYSSAIILFGFGLLTLFLSSSILFDLFGIREREGNYVLFVVWANFISSIFYLFAAYGFLAKKTWTTLLLFTSTIILIAALLGLFGLINSGGLYETKTIGALLFRISVTTAFTLLSYFKITKTKINEN